MSVQTGSDLLPRSIAVEHKDYMWCELREMATVPFCVCPNHGREPPRGLMNKAHRADLPSRKHAPLSPAIPE